MTAPEVGLREAMEALASEWEAEADVSRTGTEAAQDFAAGLYQSVNQLRTLLATDPSPPLPGQPGVAEVSATDRNVRDLAEAVADASYKVGWEGLTRQQQATECMRAEVVLRTGWFTNHVAAEAARAPGGAR